MPVVLAIKPPSLAGKQPGKHAILVNHAKLIPQAQVAIPLSNVLRATRTVSSGTRLKSVYGIDIAAPPFAFTLYLPKSLCRIRQQHREFAV